MSASSIYRAANDEELIERVTAIAHQVRIEDPTKADTDFGRSLVVPRFSGAPNPITALMFPVAVDTEAPYETALLNQRGAPGFDKDIITDAQIRTSVEAHWPMTNTPPVVPTP